MNKNDNRYVALLDILGMSSIVEKDADEAWGLLSDLVAVRDKASKLEIEFFGNKERIRLKEKIPMVTFSDTILLFTTGDSPTDLRCMIILLTEIFHKAMFRCVPVRAGLAFGKFYYNMDKSMYAGPALIEAYRIGEAAQWLGIALGDSVQDKAVGLEMMSGGREVIVRWRLPLKTGSRQCFVVNWPGVFERDMKVKPPISVEQFYQAFESSFGAFKDLSADVRVKYENTVNFMNESLKSKSIA